MAAVVEIPPERCSGCDETRLRPGWGECPQASCGAMDRDYVCANGHTTMAPWHVHRVVPTDRPRWHCGGPPPA